MGKEGKPSPLDMFMKQQEDCDRPACEDTVNALNSALSRLNMKSGGDKKKSVKAKVECPPSKSLLGDSSWNLLHSMVREFLRIPRMECVGRKILLLLISRNSITEIKMLAY